MKIKFITSLLFSITLTVGAAFAQDKPTDQETQTQYGTQRSGQVTIPKGVPAEVPWNNEQEKEAYVRDQLEFLKGRVDYSDHQGERRPMPDPTPADPASISKNGAESSKSLRAPSNINLIRNVSITPVVPSGFSSVVGEPSVAASAGNEVIYSSNWFAAQSSNGGDTFSHLDPFTGPFPPVFGGFCCDQQAEYDAVNNTLFLQQQYINNASGSAQRINVDQNADGSYNCFYDVTPGSIGFASNSLLDFPDLAVGSQFLYLSTNSFRPQGQSFTFEGAAVIRFPLSELAACSTNVNAQLHTESSFGSFRFAHGATDPMYFADHVSTSTVRIWSWSTGQTSPTSVDRSVASWTNNSRVCTDPGGFNPCDFVDSRILAGYAADGVVGFMWVPSQDGTFSFPYTRVSRFDATSNLSHIDDQDIFSNNFAYIYPSAAASGNGDVGGTIFAAGGNQALECLAFVSDDSNSNVFAPLDYVSVIQGVNGPNNDRTGDYLTTREFPSDPDQWVGTCFAFSSPTQPDSRFVQFERDAGGPVNQPPNASFTFNCTDLSCSFDGSGSSDSDGTIVNYAWTFGDSNNGSGVTTNHTYANAGTFNVTLTVTDDDGATDNQTQPVTVTAPPTGNCPAGSIDFNNFSTTAFATQDGTGSVNILDGGETLQLIGNRWRASTQTYNLTANTVVEFEFSSDSQGEIHGIGMDEDNNLTQNRIFRVFGTQNYGNVVNPQYTGGGSFQTYSIPVGQNFTGSGFRLIFVNDKDSGTPNNESKFRCVRVFEDTPTGGQCSVEVDFESGAAGWSNGAASTCSTGTYVLGTPTQESAGGIITQVGGDNTTGSGSAVFSATNTTAGNADIDGGNCVLLSPVWTVNDASTLEAFYFHGQRDSNDDPGDDFFLLEVSTNGGSSFTPFVSIGDTRTPAAWTQATTQVPAGSQVQLRMQASDGAGPGDIIEAGLDDVSICPN